MTNIPASLLIRPNEAAQRFHVALDGLLDAYGYKLVAHRLGLAETTLSRWKKGTNKPDYFVAIEIIAWYDRDCAPIKQANVTENTEADVTESPHNPTASGS